VLRPARAQQIDTLHRRLDFDSLVFARQIVYCGERIHGLAAADRVTPLLAAARALAPRYSEILLETADTDDAKRLSALCRALAVPLAARADEQGLLAPSDRAAPRLHVLLLDGSSAWVGSSAPGNSSPWPQGIPRVRVAAGAPSRSAHKLAEALRVFLTPDEQRRLLAPGARAVDLGAAPGGWTWTLIHHGVRVVAVDNGPLKGDLDNALVEHLRTDGFRYRPRKPVDWLTCDIAAPPARVAALVADWIAEGHARQAIFNLKLPMKRRFDAVEQCATLMRERLDRARLRCTLRFRQLYHDREEVTGFCRVLPKRGR